MTDYRDKINSMQVGQATPGTMMPIKTVDTSLTGITPGQPSEDQKQFNLSATVWKPFQDFIDDVGQHYSKGEKDVNDGAIGAQVLKGEKTYEQAVKDQAKAKVVTDKTGLGAVIAPGVEMLPTIKYVLEGAAEGAAGVGAVAAAGGAIAGIGTGPGAAATAAGAGLVGLGIGYTAGSFTAAANIAAGHSYMALREQGVSDTTARFTALAIGAVNGILQTLQIGKLGGAAKEAAKKEITNESGRLMLGTAMKHYVGNIATQTGLADLQKLADQAGGTVAKIIDRGANAMPTQDDIVKGFGELWGTTVQSAHGAAVMLPGMHIAGKAAGTAVKPLVKFFAQPTNVHEAMDVLHEIVTGESPEDVAAFKAATVTKPTKDTITALEHKIASLEDELSEAELQGDVTSKTETDLRAARKERTRQIKQKNLQDLKDLKADIESNKGDLRGIASDITGLTRRIAKQAVDEDYIPPEMSERLNLLKEELKATQDLQKRLEKEYNAKYKQQMRDAHTDLTNALKRIQATTGKRGKPTSKFDLDTQETLTLYENFSKDRKPDAAETHLRESAERKNGYNKESDRDVMNDKVPVPEAADPVDVAKQAIADEVAGDALIDWKDPAAIHGLADRINLLAAIGRDKRLQQKLNEAKDLVETEQAAYEDFQGESKYNVDTEEETPQALSGLEKNQRIRGAAFMTWNTLVGHLAQHKKVPQSMDRITITPELLTARDNIKAQNKVATDTMTGGKPELEKYAAKLVGKGKQQKDYGKYYDQDGVRRTYRATPWEVVQDIMDMRNAATGENAKMHRGMREGNKFTFNNPKWNKTELLPGEQSFESLLEDIQRSDPNLRELADGLLKFYNSDELYNRMNEAHLAEFGFPMPREDMYTGYRRRKGVDTGAEGSYQDTLVNGFMSTRKQSLVPPSTIEAVRSEKKYVRADAYDNLSQFISSTETWMALRGAEKRLRYVFTSGRIRETIKQKFGTDTMQIVDNMYTSMVGTHGIQHAQRNEIMSGIRQKLGPAFTYGKPLNMIKQLSSTLQALNKIGVEDYMNGIGDFVMHPIKAAKTLRNTPLWRTRYDSVFSTELAERRDMQGVFGSKLDPAAIKATGIWLTTGDKGASLAGGWAIREAKIKQALAQGKTIQEAEAAGTRAAQEWINETQSSALPDQITNWERGSEWQKASVIFAKQPIQVAGHYVLSVRRYFANPTKENFNTMARTVAAAHVAQAVFVGLDVAFYLGVKAATGSLTDKDVANNAAKMLRNLVVPGVGLPIIGDLEEYVGPQITNKMFGTSEVAHEPQFLPYRMITSGGKFVVDVGKAAIKAVNNEEVKPKDVFSILEDYADFAPALPTTPISGQAPIRPAIKAAKQLLLPGGGKKERKSDVKFY